MRSTRELAESFFALCSSSILSNHNEALSCSKKHFRQGIAVYEDSEQGKFSLKHLPAHYDVRGTPNMNVGLVVHTLF